MIDLIDAKEETRLRSMTTLTNQIFPSQIPPFRQEAALIAVALRVACARRWEKVKDFKSRCILHCSSQNCSVVSAVILTLCIQQALPVVRLIGLLGVGVHQHLDLSRTQEATLATLENQEVLLVNDETCDLCPKKTLEQSNSSPLKA